MKTNKMLPSKKTLIKTMSSVLSLVLTANAGLSVLTENVFAAGSSCTISKSDNTITLRVGSRTEPDPDFYLVDNSGRTMISKSQIDYGDAEIADGRFNLNIYDYAKLSTYTDGEFINLTLLGDAFEDSTAFLTINSGNSFTVLNTLSGKGNTKIYNYGALNVQAEIHTENGNNQIYNYGTLTTRDNITASDSGASQIYNHGFFEVDPVFDTHYLGTGFINCADGKLVAETVNLRDSIYSDEEGSEIRVSKSITVEGRSINSLVIAEPDTRIFCEDGTFTLQVGNVKKVVSGIFTGKASELLGDPDLFVYEDTITITPPDDGLYHGYFIDNIDGLKIYRDSDKENAASIKDYSHVIINGNCGLTVETDCNFQDIQLNCSPDVSLNTKLKINDGCTVTSIGDISVNSNCELNNYGNLETTAGDLSASSGGVINNYGNLEAIGDLSASSGGVINNHGYLRTMGELSADSGGEINNYESSDIYKSLSLDNSEFHNYGTVNMCYYQDVSGSGNNGIFNYGTMDWASEFKASVLADNGITKIYNGENGKIAVYNAYFDDDIYSDAVGSEIIVKIVFMIDCSEMNAVVIVQNNTFISSSGKSTFTLQVGDAKITIPKVELNYKMAIDLMNTPSLTLDEVPDAYVGQDIDTGSYVHTDADYPGEVYFEYSSDGSTWSADKPTTKGDYYIRAVAPSAGSYVSATSASQQIKFDYLPFSEVDANGNYYTFADVYGEHTVNDKVKVVPAEGFKIYCSHTADQGYADYLMIAEDDILVNGSVNTQAFFKFKRISDGAETKEIYATSISSPSFEDLIFDTSAPQIVICTQDPGTGEYNRVVPIDGENTVIVADSLSVEVTDTLLGPVLLDVNGDEDDANYLTHGSNCHFYLEGKVAEKKVVTITARDYFGQETVVKFTLYHEPVDPKLKVTLPDKIYVGDDYMPEVETDSDGEITIRYTYTDRNLITSTPPTAAGKYGIYVDTAETAYYKAAHIQMDFEILKHDLAATVSVEDIPYGGTVSPVMAGVPGDYTGAIIYEYKLSTAADTAYSVTVPTAPGTYSVRAVLAETDLYLGYTCTNTFRINKKGTAATVSVADITIGGTVNPVVTTESDGTATFQYKLSSEPDTAYSSTVPTAAGTYTVKATISETATYLSTTCTASFKINKKTAEASVSVADINVGGTVSPVVTTESDGAATFQYKLSTEPDTAYSSTVPAAAGIYTIKATISETVTYLSTTCTGTFTINKNPVTASVSVADIYVGGTPSPVVTSISDGKDRSSFEYKLSTDTEYSSVVPFKAGTYTVRATIPETDTYLGTTCTGTFTINKNAVTASVSVADISIGGTVKPVVSTESDGTPSFEYKLANAPESDYSATVPSAAGTYSVRARIPETDTYLSTTCTGTFRIKKLVTEAEVAVEDIFVGGTVSPVVTTESDGIPSFEYKLSADPESEYSSAVPSAADTYSIRARIPETDEYESITCTSEFTIRLNKVTLMELTIKDFYVGQSVDIEYKSNSDGKMSVMYKRSDAPDSAYTSVAPKDPGKYTARATVPATDIYESASCTTEFSITYLEAPQTAFIPTGKEGNNDYFTSDVVLKAPDGYKISSTFGQNYAPSIPYTEDLEKIYLKRDDGALTAAITITNKPKIDKSAPTLTSSTGDLNEGDVIYASSMDVDVSDLNLTSITVNGEKVDLKSLKGRKLTLSSGMGTADYKITAEDVAGNITTIDFTLKAEWLENKVILPGVALPLAEDESYTLDSGSWTVTMNDADGNIVEDTTVYNGDMPVYVNAGGNYTFTKVN